LQVTETEIVLPFSLKHSLPRGNPLQTSLAGVIPLGGGIILLVLQAGLLFPLVFIAAGFLLLISPVIMAWASKGVSRQFVRMNHEGVLFASLLPSAGSMGRYFDGWPLHVDLYGASYQLVKLCASRSCSHDCSYHRTKSKECVLSFVHENEYVALSLFKCSLSFDDFTSGFANPSRIELLALMQERFANELRGSRVTVLGWQERGGHLV
jgi:hypothetical protein